VPYDVAFGLDDVQRMAYVVVLGQLDGLVFDWRRMSWHDA
jgi:hypothetical protein